VAQLEIDGWLGSSSWTDVTGKFKVEATFVRIDQQNVVLKKADGKEISVPLSKLNEESRRRATEAAKSKATVGSPTTGKSTSSAATPSKPTLSTSSTAIAIPANLEAKPFVDFLVQQAKEGRPIVLWDAMPAKYHNDINRVVKLAAEKVDPTLVKPVVNTLYDPTVDLIEAYIPADLLDPKQLSQGNLRPVLESYLTRVAQKAKALEAAVPKESSAYEIVKSANWENFQYEVESSSGDSATLVVKGANAPEQRVELVRVEDRWLPQPMAAGWDANIEQAIQQLGKITPQSMTQAKQSMQMPMALVGGVVNGLLQANDQASFDEAVAGIMSMIPMGGGMGMPGMQPGMPMPGMKPPAP
jgi:hypothetical protein